MLRVLEASESTSVSYRVPWTIDRGTSTHARIRNASTTRLSFVRVFVDDPQNRRTHHWGHAQPGETVELCLCGIDTDEAVVTIAWFRNETDEEYCWRFVM